MDNKPEFQLAMSIFVAMAVIGTAFGLWWAAQLASVKPRANVEASSQAAPPAAPQVPPEAAPAGK